MIRKTTQDFFPCVQVLVFLSILDIENTLNIFWRGVLYQLRLFPWALRVARVFYEILKPVFAGYIDDSNYIVDTVDVGRQTTLQGYLYFKVFNHTPAYQNLSSRNHRDFLGSFCIHAL